MKFKKLPEHRFWLKYQKGFSPVDVPTDADKEALRKRISSLQAALVEQLSKEFEEESDFAIGWDFNYCFHVCGGIYTDSTIGRTLLECIQSALNTDSDPSSWTFHAAVETEGIAGQFYVRAGEVVYPDDGPDFSKRMA